MKRNIKYISFLLILVSGLMAGESNTGYFMRFSTSARSSAMGRTGIAFIDDPAAVYWNPANLAGAGSKQLLLLHSQYFISDVNYDFASFILPDKGKTFGFAVARLAVDNIADTRQAKFITQGGDDWRLDYSKISYFSTADYVFYFSYAQDWNEKLKVGLTAKLLYRDFSSEVAFGIGFDAGATYALDDDFIISAVLQDITTSPIIYSTDKSEITIPRLRAGTIYHYRIKDMKLRISPTFQFDLAFDDLPGALANVGPMSLDIPAGLELAYDELFFARAGLDENIKPTFGAGFSLGGFTIDYAFSSYRLPENVPNLIHANFT